MSKKIIVVGGVAGGATAIARLRRLDEDAQIILIEKGEYVSFANCGLPYYIGGTIQNRDALFVSNKASIEGKYGVEIRVLSQVTSVHPEEKYICVKNLETNEEYQETYDKLLLSTGSTPFIPNIKGKEFDNVFTLWNIPDTDHISAYMKEHLPKKAVVAGGGFIGLEMTENLRERGLEVTLVEFADQVMAPLDKDMAKIAENHLLEKGVDVRLSTGVVEILDHGKQVALSDGSVVDTDMILLSVGVRPNTEFLKDTSIKMNDRGGVIVDEYMQTSNQDIYAVGDMIEVYHPIRKEKTMIPLAGPANKQGRAVGANILGKEKEGYMGTIGTSVAKVFDLTVASTGENEKALEKKGLKRWKDYGVALIHPSSHAGYYPGAVPMTLKLLFAMEDGMLLGAQIVGYDGVDKRIDTIATSIHFHGTTKDLTEIELAYAPPFSSAKDPINMAGYVAENIRKGLSTPILYQEYIEEEEQYQLMDVREDMERMTGFIEDSIHIPLTKLRQRIQELDKDKTYVLYCAVGLRGYLAERILKQKGYQVRNLAGGYRTYKEMEMEQKGENRMDSVEQDKLPVGNDSVKTIELDVCGLSCPGPIMSVSKKMDEMGKGEILNIRSTDPGFARDIESWCNNTGNRLISRRSEKGIFTADIQKGEGKQDNICQVSSVKEKTMIVFDGDLDKAIAAFIIATGSAAMGNKVNMFFTFWGLNVIRKPNRMAVKKDVCGTMFGKMMPRGSKKLKLSKMNFMGAGSWMMKQVMKKKGISSLEELIEKAQELGVKMTACQMSMDVMGITKEELLDGVEIGGVATMLDDNDHSNMNLFI